MDGVRRAGGTGGGRALLLAAALAAGPLAAQSITAPSGQELTLYDVILEPESGYARFRFLAPAIGGAGALGHEAVFPDFQWLCDSVALPELLDGGWSAAQIVITLSDREVDQGVMDPEAVQFFEGFSVAEGACIWEPF
jgi:hypothetical protein